MQIKISTDYALRIMMHVAASKEIVTSRELSERLMIPQSLVFKTCKKLGNSGMLKITTGVQGGFSLLKMADEISLYDIIYLFEPKLQMNRCLEDGNHCDLCTTNSCIAHEFFCKLQRELEDKLKNKSLRELIEHRI